MMNESRHTKKKSPSDLSLVHAASVEIDLEILILFLVGSLSEIVLSFAKFDLSLIITLAVWQCKQR